MSVCVQVCEGGSGSGCIEKEREGMANENKRPP